MCEVVLDGRCLLALRELRLPTGISQRQVEPLLILAVPPLQCILGWVTQLTDGRAGAFAELDVELNGSDSVFVGIHELPSSSPSFRPHPRLVRFESAPTALQSVVDVIRPTHVVHLAAISFVQHGRVEDIYRINVVGTRNLLQALTSVSGVQAVLLASSANIYGNNLMEDLTEDVAPAPANDYAISKVAMEYVARLWSDKLPVIVTRPFNYTGVGQAAHFLIPKMISHFQQKAARIELGNLEVARDFSDVRVVVDVYRRLMLEPNAVGGIFNVCSGYAYTLRQIMQMLFELTGHKMEVCVNPAFVRANEVKLLLGSRKRLERVVGDLRPVSMEDTLRWMFSANA